MAISNYSTTASSNTAISGINIAENCPPGNMNGALRQAMADIRTEMTDAVLSLTAKATVAEIRVALDALEATPAVEAVGALTPAADKLPYYTGASAAALTTLTSFIRTLLDDADADTACTTLGAVRIVAVSLANPGYIKIKFGSSGTAILQWGMTSIGQDSSVAVTYPTPFASFSIPIVGGITKVGNQENENTGMTNGSATVNGFTLYNAQNATFSVPWFAIGV